MPICYNIATKMADQNHISITFYGGVGSVTGANFLLESGDPDASTAESKVGAMSTKVLIDCGFFQGSRVAEKQNAEKFPYDPATIDALFVTHAHLDHIGRIPKLVRDGFHGKIYSTQPTKEISELSLVDSLGVLEKEAKTSGEAAIYDEHDVRQAMSLWHTVKYHEPFTVGHWQVELFDAGHILGSAMFQFVDQSSHAVGRAGKKKIVFTGDMGNSPSLLLEDTEDIKDADYLVMESVYGDRNHEPRAQALQKLEDTIEETMSAGGTLMIPAFSIERTQEMLHEIEEMMEKSRIPLVPVYIDSPLAIKVTDIYAKHANYFNQKTIQAIAHGNAIFRFPQLIKTLTTEESKAIAGAAKRKIVIAGSGMSNGGRILHHEKRYLPDPNSALILAGYQAAGSLGRQLQEGAKRVKIMGEDIPVRARIVSLSGYSAHKGSDDLFEFAAQSSDTLKKVFIVMGEPKSSLFLAQRLRDYLGLNAVVPEAGQKVSLTI